MIKIGVVPYINALPLCRYLELPVTFATPAQLDRQMADGDLDLALLPSLSYLNHPSYVGHFHAGIIQSRGPVESVALFYRQELQKPQNISTIKYSEESITSISLFKVIYNQCWGLDHTRLKISKFDADACLFIGDAALFFDKPGYQKCDLGEVWTQWTGFPFIYALWVSLKPLSARVLKALAHARIEGLSRIDDIVAGSSDLPPDKMKNYLTQSIQYEMETDSLAGLKLFQKYCFEMGLLKEKRAL